MKTKKRPVHPLVDVCALKVCKEDLIGIDDETVRCGHHGVTYTLTLSTRQYRKEA